jgi:hypothetical protein
MRYLVFIGNFVLLPALLAGAAVLFMDDMEAADFIPLYIVGTALMAIRALTDRIMDGRLDQNSN